MDTASDRANPSSPGLGAPLARVGLVGTGLLAWRAASVLWEGGTTPTAAHATALMIAVTLCGFALLLFAVIDHRHLRKAQWLIPPVLVLIALCYLQNHRVAQLENGPVTTDVQIYTDYAARLLLEGVNPYSTDLLDSYRVHRMPFTFSTPLSDGELTGRVAYPALHLLIFVPFQWLGIDTRYVYLLSLVVMLAVLYVSAPRTWRPLVLLPFFLDSRFLLFTFGGVSDCVWAMLLCFMVLQWRKRWARAIRFGLAACVKHQPWVLAPFLLIRIWHEARDQGRDRGERLREIGRFAGLSTAVFFVVNLPFIVWSPADWLAGVFEPVRAPMVTFGQGLSAISMSGMAPLPKWLFSALLATVLLCGLLLFAAYYRRLRLALWIIPGLALWFSHRSLSSYWYFFMFPLVADWLRTRGADLTGPAPDRGGRAPLWVAAAAIVSVGTLTLVTALNRQPALAVAVQWPLLTSGGDVTKMTVDVENRSDKAVRPRIAVQSVGLQPYFWTVDSGPVALAPGARGQYRVRAGAPFERFSVRHGARVIVTSADDLDVRVATRVPGDVTDAYRDAIPNGAFRYWDESSSRPAFWGVVAEPAAAGSARPGRPSGEGAPASSVQLELRSAADGDEPRRILVDTYVVLPHAPVRITVRLPMSANRLPDMAVLYGLRLVADRQEAWVLFGDEERQGRVEGRIHYRMLSAPREQWSTHSIDLRELLTEAGIEPLPVYGRRLGALGIDYPVLPANVQLMLAVDAPVARLAAEFGPLVSGELRPQAGELFAESRAQPEMLRLWRGNLAFSYGNYDKARDHYREAARLAPAQALPLLRLGEAELWAGRFEEALRAYLEALDLEATEPLAYKGAGWCHYNLGSYPEAIAAWRGALRMLDLEGPASDPAHEADVLKGIGMAEMREGRCADGRDYFERARELVPVIDVPAEVLQSCE